MWFLNRCWVRHHMHWAITEIATSRCAFGDGWWGIMSKPEDGDSRWMMKTVRQHHRLSNLCIFIWYVVSRSILPCILKYSSSVIYHQVMGSERVLNHRMKSCWPCLTFSNACMSCFDGARSAYANGTRACFYFANNWLSRDHPGKPCNLFRHFSFVFSAACWYEYSICPCQSHFRPLPTCK